MAGGITKILGAVSGGSLRALFVGSGADDNSSAGRCAGSGACLVGQARRHAALVTPRRGRLPALGSGKSVYLHCRHVPSVGGRW